MRTTSKVVGVFAAATLTLTACSGSGSGSGSTTDGGSSAEHNNADVEFATEMIPHHAQAVEMAELAETRAESPEVSDLAADIAAAQGPEIEQLTGMLDAWGEDVPDLSGGDGMAGMDHGATGDEMDDESSAMDGTSDTSAMMSDSDMADLEAASGSDFDELFLSLMLEHHAGAIEMAKAEQADGENSEAVALAEDIENAQTRESQTIRGLLGS